LQQKLPAKPISDVCARITKTTSVMTRATASLWFVTAWAARRRAKWPARWPWTSCSSIFVMPGRTATALIPTAGRHKLRPLMRNLWKTQFNWPIAPFMKPEWGRWAAWEWDQQLWRRWCTGTRWRLGMWRQPDISHPAGRDPAAHPGSFAGDGAGEAGLHYAGAGGKIRDAERDPARAGRRHGSGGGRGRPGSDAGRHAADDIRRAHAPRSR